MNWGRVVAGLVAFWLTVLPVGFIICMLRYPEYGMDFLTVWLGVVATVVCGGSLCCIIGGLIYYAITGKT